jgi:hypothetical protein
VRPVALAACLLAALLAASALPGPGVAADGRHWHPRPTTAPWQWQLQGRIDTHFRAPVYDIDGFETPRSTVRKLHRLHRKVICYLDVGSWETYRPDAKDFPRSAIGRRYAGFPDERWLDVSRFHRFARPLKRRFSICARKGFDAVEPDNLAGWEKENRTGFHITRADQLRFNRWVARQVHGRGMAVALKNDGRQAEDLVGTFDFAIVEQCFQYHECGYYRAFVRHRKAVFETEYEQKPKQYCKTAQAIGFSAIHKSYDLFARPWHPCGAFAAGPVKGAKYSGHLKVATTETVTFKVSASGKKVIGMRVKPFIPNKCGSGAGEVEPGRARFPRSLRKRSPAPPSVPGRRALGSLCDWEREDPRKPSGTPARRWRNELLSAKATRTAGEERHPRSRFRAVRRRA